MRWYNPSVYPDIDLSADFFGWVLTSLRSDPGSPKKILAYETEEASLLAPLLKEGLVLDDLSRRELAGAADAAYDLILCPTLFLSLEKDAAPDAARLLQRLLAPGGDAFILFPPSWLPPSWSEKVLKFHKEGNTKLYFRFKSHISAYTYFTNREIELLAPALHLERLTILRDGFRRAHFCRRTKEKS